MASRIDFDLSLGTRPSRPRRRAEGDPMRILVVGDFSGRGAAEASEPLAERRVFAVDVDCFDDVLAKLAPRAVVPGGAGGAPADFEPREIDDFHPDALCRRLPALVELEDLRRRLRTPSAFAGAAETVRALVSGLPPPAGGEAPQAAAPLEEGDAATLERLLGRKPGGSPALSPADPVGDFVRKLAAEASLGASAPQAGPELAVYLEALDQAAGARLRAVLHAPGFRALEAAWRSLHELVRGVETGEELSLHVLDATKAELAADLRAAGGDPGRSSFRRLLARTGGDVPGSPGWSVLAADFTFGADPGDLALLEALGAVASSAGAPFLAAASPEVVGCPTAEALADPARWAPPTEAWQRLRHSPAAPWLALALPRVLLRLPYGPRREEIDVFPFDEAGAVPDRDALLWGSPALLCARLIAAAFERRGWAGEPGDVLDVGGLPSLDYLEDGERKRVPCAEAWLGERAGEALLARGLVPFLSRRDQNAVRALRFQSLADPPEPLSGPWSFAAG